jgi:ATP-dependent RNA helicase DHX37/DHR1
LSSSVLHSSASLGTGKLSTHQELQEKAEDRDIRKALNGLSGKRKRHQDHFLIHAPDEDDDVSEVESHPEKEWLEQNAGTSAEQDTNVVIPPIDSIQSRSKAHSLPVLVGNALQRNPDGSTIAPKVRAKSEKKVPFLIKCVPDAHHKIVNTSWLGSTTYCY